MTASVGRKVQANPLFSAALEGAPAQSEHAGSEDLGDLGEAVGGGHKMKVKGITHHRTGAKSAASTYYLPIAPDFCLTTVHNQWSILVG
jgi:hypothetical protein